MMNIFWGPFALGVLVGVVGAIPALLAFVEVESVETGKDGKIMKDCLTKPLKVINVCDIKVGDFIHDISSSNLADSEKRKGHVLYVDSLIGLGEIALGLSGRNRPLKVPATANAVITDALDINPHSEIQNRKVAHA